jgi:hypothetical protein
MERVSVRHDEFSEHDRPLNGYPVAVREGMIWVDVEQEAVENDVE